MAEPHTSEAAAVARTARLLRQDPWRWQCLLATRSLALNDWYLGAGFLRNAIWDAWHGYARATPLNDVDVVYFEPGDITQGSERAHEHRLAEHMPAVTWQVRNQARMHLHHGHAAYRSAADAISRWVEVPTCVGVRLNCDDTLTFTAPFGLVQNWSGEVTINPHFPRPDIYRQRVQTKGWQTTWPGLIIRDAE